MKINKLGRTTTQRRAIVKGQASDLFWYGKIETTLARAKSVSSYAEKLLTLAINSYDDTVSVKKKVKGADGKMVTKQFMNDGVKKLNARRTIMSKLYDINEQKGAEETEEAYKARTKDIKHPLIEKIFNVYAPKYAERNKKENCSGGYTRILKLEKRRGDIAQMVLIELI